MSNLSNMRKKIDAMRMDREAWTARKIGRAHV